MIFDERIKSILAESKSPAVAAEEGSCGRRRLAGRFDGVAPVPLLLLASPWSSSGLDSRLQNRTAKTVKRV